MWSFMNYVKLIKSMEALIGSIYDESASPLHMDGCQPEPKTKSPVLPPHLCGVGQSPR